MDFGLSDEQRDIQGLARQILGDLSTPERLARYDDGVTPRFDRELWAKLAEAGLLGVAVPEQHGGMGFGFMELALLAEEAGRTIAAVPLLAHQVGGMQALVAAGSAEQKQRLLARATAGEIVLSAALEEGAGIDPCVPRTTAQVYRGGYALNGCKLAVPFAAQAERIVLGAATDRGVVVLLLDPRAPGVRVTPVTTSSNEPQAQLDLVDARVDAADVLAGPADGALLLDSIVRQLRAAQCMHQLGVCSTMLQMTARYTSERKQFGVPIATFQAVGHRAANCFIDVECLKLCAYEAAQHLHGGAGVDRANALWRFCLWARHNEMTLGSSGTHLASLGKRCASGEALLA
jgi:alkylation response protein AidB-like acyl-CoA dehydrogenase